MEVDALPCSPLTYVCDTEEGHPPLLADVEPKAKGRDSSQLTKMVLEGLALLSQYPGLAKIHQITYLKLFTKAYSLT